LSMTPKMNGLSIGRLQELAVPTNLGVLYSNLKCGQLYRVSIFTLIEGGTKEFVNLNSDAEFIRIRIRNCRVIFSRKDQLRQFTALPKL
jgi:hypothetical protein